MIGFFKRVARKVGAIYLINIIYDTARFSESKNSLKQVRYMDSERAAMHLLRLMHSLEKGLALPSPLPGFGKEKAIVLKEEAESYLAKFGDDEIYQLCMAVLLNHQEFQNSIKGENARFSEEALRTNAKGIIAGSRTVKRDEIWRYGKIDFDSFSSCRSSIRNFTGETVPEEDIIDAIRIATKSPSVCNRSCGRAYYSVDPDIVSKILSQQNGNRGFGHLAGGVIIVAADMRAFYKSGERNQGWIDGGLFAMSLNYALHAKGYGVCMLNWSEDAPHDSRFRKKLGIPREHLVVMMMAVGHMPEELKVAISPRRNISKFAIKIAS